MSNNNFLYYNTLSSTNNLILTQFNNIKFERKIIFKILRAYLTKDEINIIKENKSDKNIIMNKLYNLLPTIKNKFIEKLLNNYIQFFIYQVIKRPLEITKKIKKIKLITFVNILNLESMNIDFLYEDFCNCKWRKIPYYIYDHKNCLGLWKELPYIINISDFILNNEEKEENIIYICRDLYYPLIRYIEKNNIKNGNLYELLQEFQYYDKSSTNYYEFANYYDNEFHVNIFK